MALKNFLILYSSLLCSTCIAQDSDIIIWSDTTKLTWNAFSNTPIKSSVRSAASATTIDFHLDYNSDSAVFTIHAIFNLSESWVKDENMSENLLGHEQLHFDIVELFARYLRAEILDCKFKAKNVKKKAEIILNNIHAQVVEYQALYDEETKHSLLKDAQEEWEQQVADELEQLKDYSQTRIVIYF